MRIITLSINFLQRPQCPPHEDVWVKWVNTDKKDTSKGNFVYTLKAHQSRNDNDGSYYESENYPSECQTPICITLSLI